MKVEFKRTTRIEGVTYKPGIHSMPEELRDHWYLKATIINGHAFIRSEAPALDECGDDTVESEVIDPSQVDKAAEDSEATIIQKIEDGEIKEEIVDKKANSKKGKKKKDA